MRCLEYKNVNWIGSGLCLELSYPSLKDIEKRNDIVIDKCMREMLLAWVQQGDHVSRCLQGEEIPFMEKASRCTEADG